uniref:Uncharacterized protein n=1 Tax=Oryza rufipogon TaxID=4529 RepID=A0A0E0P0M9_ORYRU
MCDELRRRRADGTVRAMACNGELVEALHRPPAVGIGEPRRALLLLVLLVLAAAAVLAVDLGLLLAVGALGVATNERAYVSLFAGACPTNSPSPSRPSSRRVIRAQHKAVWSLVAIRFGPVNMGMQHGRASVDTSIWVTAVLVGNHEERKERGPIYRLQNPQRAYPT